MTNVNTWLFMLLLAVSWGDLSMLSAMPVGKGHMMAGLYSLVLFNHHNMTHER